MEKDFTTLVLRFTDGTAEEIRKASAGPASSPDGHVRSAAEDLAKGFRKNLNENLDLRLLADVLGGGNRGSFFLASFRMGGAFAGPSNVLFIVDPEGLSPRGAGPGGVDDMERHRSAALGGLQDGTTSTTVS